MKKYTVKITSESKNAITLATALAAKKMVRLSKEETWITDVDLSIAATVVAGNGDYQFYDVECIIAGHDCCYDLYGDDSGNLDIWISFKMFEKNRGFWEVGCYYSDINSVTAENKAAIRKGMFIQEYRYTGIQ